MYKLLPSPLNRHWKFERNEIFDCIHRSKWIGMSTYNFWCCLSSISCVWSWFDLWKHSHKISHIVIYGLALSWAKILRKWRWDEIWNWYTHHIKPCSVTLAMTTLKENSKSAENTNRISNNHEHKQFVYQCAYAEDVLWIVFNEGWRMWMNFYRNTKFRSTF